MDMREDTHTDFSLVGFLKWRMFQKIGACTVWIARQMRIAIAEYSLFYRALLQKRPTISRIDARLASPCAPDSVAAIGDEGFRALASLPSLWSHGHNAVQYYCIGPHCVPSRDRKCVFTRLLFLSRFWDIRQWWETNDINVFWYMRYT